MTPTPATGAALPAATAAERTGGSVRSCRAVRVPRPNARRERNLGIRWSGAAQPSLTTRLRTLVVLGLVFVLVAAFSLRSVGGLPSWLAPAGTGTVVGSMPSPGAPGELK